jgi:predicted Zn finger-like uncharacterized protein
MPIDGTNRDRRRLPEGATGMNIECTDCHARYTIADSLVPPQGARVKCRKCGAVISVKPAQPIVSPPELPLIPPKPEPAPQARPAEPRSFERGVPRESPEESEAPAETAPPTPLERMPSPFTPSAPPPDPVFERFSSTPSAHEAHAPTEFERFPSAPPASASVESARPAPVESARPAPVESARPAPVESVRQAPVPPPMPAPVTSLPEPAPPAPPARTAAETPRPRISATTVPEGLSPEEMQRHERARRLARVLASDIAIYNREKRERGIRDGNLVAVLGYEIKKSWETYKERVGAEFANATPYFRDALNEIVAEGQKIF